MVRVSWQLRWFCCLMALGIAPAMATNLSWSGAAVGNSNWSDTNNWLQGESPTGNDLVIGDVVVGDTSVNTDFSIASLLLTGGSTADTAGNSLIVDGMTTVTANGSKLVISPHADDAMQSSAILSQAIVQSGGEIQLLGGVLEIDEPDTPTATLTVAGGGLLSGHGTLLLSDSLGETPTVTFINDGLLLTTASEELSTLTIRAIGEQHRLDLDGTTDTGIVSIAAGTMLDLQVATEVFGGLLNLDSGATLQVAHQLDLVEASLTLSSIDAEAAPATLRSDSTVTIDSSMLNVTGHTSRIEAPFHFTSSSSGGTLVASDSRLVLAGDGEFDGGSSHTGDGTLAFEGGHYTISGTQLFDMTGGTIVLDADTEQAETWQLDARLVVSASQLDDFGDNSNDQTDTIAIHGASGQLVVSQGSSNSWTLAPQGKIEIHGTSSFASSLRGDNIAVAGTIEVIDSTKTEAKLSILSGGQVTIATEGQALQLAAGNSTDPHRIAGGVISGPGTLTTDGQTSLEGFGTIDAPVDFPASSSLWASGGTLTINTQVLDAEWIGTAASTGSLHLAAGLDTSNVRGLELKGGVVTGSYIANNGITRGNGSIEVTSFYNNGVLHALAGEGDTLVVAAANSIDLDGALLVAGEVQATSANLTIAAPLSDDFGGKATVGAGRALRFEQGWILAPEGLLTLSGDGSNAASLVADSQIAGPVVVHGMAMMSGTTTFMAGSSVELVESTDSLELEGTSTVEANASFTGLGSVVNQPMSVLTMADNSTLGVTLANEGELQIGHHSLVLSYEQLASGTLGITLDSVDSYDQLFYETSVSLSGGLQVLLGEGYLPTIGDSFTIITGAGNLTGGFDENLVEAPALAGALGWQLDYTSSEVLLSVVQLTLKGDFNADGIVNLADYTLWRDHLGSPDESVLSGNGDNENGVDAADYVLWKQHFGESIPTDSLVSQAVPEPSCLAIAMLGLLLVPAVRKACHS
ncbi:hypothetical protein [Aeoliella mucimassa]|uniref:Dockerin domain-containing protein n=1 Tax=Aeoliella mucimassa TaxID=2527972 RepID=A0A518AU71_9BACT|nr:hypothetical protein [Aeoliella mucimassa]QDU58280.1 hypothetical protein Pan181_45130 [Aeoliella mucimassa]